jgi:hypothetical protein
MLSRELHEERDLRGDARGWTARAVPPKRAASWVTFMSGVELTSEAKWDKRVHLMSKMTKGPEQLLKEGQGECGKRV